MRLKVQSLALKKNHHLEEGARTFEIPAVVAIEVHPTSVSMMFFKDIASYNETIRVNFNPM